MLQNTYSAYFIGYHAVWIAEVMTILFILSILILGSRLCLCWKDHHFSYMNYQVRECYNCYSEPRWFIIDRKWCSFLKGMGCSFGMFSVRVVFPMTMIWGLVSFSATQDHSSKKYWQSTTGHSQYPASRLESVLGLSYPHMFLDIPCRLGMSQVIIHILFKSVWLFLFAFVKVLCMHCWCCKT